MGFGAHTTSETLVGPSLSIHTKRGGIDAVCLGTGADRRGQLATGRGVHTNSSAEFSTGLGVGADGHTVDRA